MRLLSLFFALYFACLSTMTCTDEVVVCQDQTPTTVTAASHSDGGSDALGDWCSPLCQCHCCGGVVMTWSTPRLGTFPTRWNGAVAPPRPAGHGGPHAGLRRGVATAPGLTLPFFPADFPPGSPLAVCKWATRPRAYCAPSQVIPPQPLPLSLAEVAGPQGPFRKC
ncbi:hypothetical protein H9L05_22035 (plasmid) [Hymenobacter qilianensis]|uniref:Secreted protein n=1 Tax=Hymenobacter qilianensis TaxID=1385715 RepID=A0A7H0H1E6_9BACT|nr:DUF6660 family protein [Hymenobacter qilianensis]QNP54362.1 hypothetical protein H9L05_22035 [Hymenobacter qilianensis]